ncbi:AraC family transcriptional regulator [Saccharibacillus sp. O16]|nr:AraC family transcriptional regulator [Saccharibacillus sp. O16]
MNIPQGIYGFRFTDHEELPLGKLFAVGHSTVDTADYRWDGLKRTDGPLLLFQYTLSGEGIYETEGQSHRVTTGQAFLTEIPSAHHYYYDPASQQPWTFLFVLLRPDLILPHWQKYRRENGCVVHLESDSPPIRLLRLVVADAAAGRISDPLAASSWVYQFMTELVRLPLTDQRDRSNWPDAVRQTALFIEQHYAQMIGIEQLAERVSLSKYHLIRRFSISTGVTPGAYLARVRVEQAMELLRGSSLSIEVIAQQVGYSSGSYFIKVFHRLTNLTPGQFRHGSESLVYRKLFWD